MLPEVRLNRQPYLRKVLLIFNKDDGFIRGHRSKNILYDDFLLNREEINKILKSFLNEKGGQYDDKPPEGDKKYGY